MVVGNYIYSLLLGMSVPDVSGRAIANLEVESLRHVAPTFHGDTIYGETTVLDKRESASKPDRGVVTSRPGATSRTARWSASSAAGSWCPRRSTPTAAVPAGADPERPSFPDARQRAERGAAPISGGISAAITP